MATLYSGDWDADFHQQWWSFDREDSHDLTLLQNIIKLPLLLSLLRDSKNIHREFKKVLCRHTNLQKKLCLTPQISEDPGKPNTKL